MFDDLDRLLQTRKKPEVPEHLSARILAAAARQDAVRLDGVRAARGGRGWFAGLVALPVFRPAFALVVLVLFLGGVYAGAAFELGDVLPSFSDENLASFMAVDDDFSAGDWV